MSKIKLGNLIQIPNILISNPKIQSNTTFLYMCIKLKAQLQKDGSFKLNMYSNNFLEFIGWTQPTMKKHLLKLVELGLVLNYKIYKYKPMIIYIAPIIDDYTQIDSKTIYQILETCNNVKTKQGLKSYREQGIRLYYYYEKNVNEEQGYAYPTMEQSKRDCKLSKDTVNYLNKHFKKQKLLYIEHGEKIIIDQNGNPRKENNKYIPLCNDRKWK